MPVNDLVATDEADSAAAALPARFRDAFDAASGTERRAAIVSDIIDHLYTAYQKRARAIPVEAEQAFDQRDWRRSLSLSRERMTLFRRYHDRAHGWLAALGLTLGDHEEFWETVYRLHIERITGIYHGDIAYAFLSSLRRRLTRDRWRVLDYSYARATGAKRPSPDERETIHASFEIDGPITPATIQAILAIPGFQTAFRDIEGDSAKVAARINEKLGVDRATDQRLEIINSGFYRNRGAYLVGCVVRGETIHPIALALLNDRSGIFVDAVIADADRLRYIFSSSLANFHVTNPNFHEIIDFLFRLMPKRPRGLHYSTIGFNHVGKFAVMRQLEREMNRHDGVFDYAPGPRGSVAIGFTAPDIAYVFKVIRNHPTAQYKWGSFPGVDVVLGKYRQVHELNRAGSMLDNVMYDNVALPRRFFGDELAAELLEAASDNVMLQGEQIVFHHLIGQMKMTPLPEFLKTASVEEAEQAISSLGRCIKNNAAANVFNKDLDGRNYGVGQSLKVYLFDYDAVEPLTDVKIRTNADRIEGEEDVPDWFFEDGIIFLPEEIELHLRINDRHLRERFRAEHGDLLQTDFWLKRQVELRAGRVPHVSTYPEECRI